jgi:ribonuclease D
LFALNRRLSDEEINGLEPGVYEGPIHVIHSHDAMVAAVNELQKEELLGFDIEKRPSFRKGVAYPPAIVQLAGRKSVYVFLLHRQLPQEITSVLSNSLVIKAGIAVARDIKELRELREFEPRNFVDLGILAKNSGLQHHGLRGLAALLLGCRVSKRAKLTNWDSRKLPRHAIQYAATDAWMSRRIYEAMRELGCTEGPKTEAMGLTG